MTHDEAMEYFANKAGKLQAAVIATSSYETVVVIGHDLLTERHDQYNESFLTGLRIGLEAAGIEVLRP